MAFRTSLLVNLCAGVVVLGLALLVVSVVSTGRAVEALSGALTSRVMAHVEARLEGFFDPVMIALEIVAERMDDGVFDDQPPARMDDFYAPLVESLPQLSSLMHAYDDGREYMLLATEGDHWQSRITDPAGVPGVAFVRRWVGSPEETPMVEQELDYDARGRPWFTGALERMQAVGADAPVRDRMYWTSPYRFFTTQDPGITASLALLTANGNVAVIGFDILLSDISRFTMDLSVGERGKVFVMRGDPAVPQDIAIIGLPDHPGAEDPEAISRLVLSTPAELGGPVADLLSTPFPTDGVSRPFASGGERWWGAVAPSGLRISNTLWVGAVVPEDELQAGLPDVFVWILVGTGVVLVAAFLRARRLSRLYGAPLADLAQKGERMERLDFQARGTTESTIVEIRQLGSTLDSMRESLARFSAEREDLRVARSVREMTVPDGVEAPQGWSLAHWHEPAPEVEGELVDVLAGDQGLHLLLADGVGSGVRAAVDGATLRGAFRALVGHGAEALPLAESLREVAARDGGSVRGWVLALDPQTGDLHAVPMGGEPLAIRRADGEVSLLPARREGDEEGAAQVRALTLRPGDALLLTSDGVTRALDEQRRRFGEDGLTALLGAAAPADAPQLLSSLREALEAFDCDTPRDRTALALMRSARG